MKKQFFSIIGMIVWFGGFSQSITPDVTTTTGDYNQGTSASLSWTLGEPVIETATGSNAILTQGFQQNSYQIVNVFEKPELSFEITAYPNPTTDFVNIKTNSADQDLILELFDLQGKRLKKAEMQKNIVQINLSEYAGSSYILKATNKTGKLLKSWKIVKK